MSVSDIVTETDIKKTIKESEPDKFDVLLLNDDVTTVEFVLHLLKSVFGKTADQAEAIVHAIEKNNAGVAGTYFFEIAEQKGIEGTLMAREEGHPLQIKIQKSKS